jgi:hypothetical protein
MAKGLATTGIRAARVPQQVQVTDLTGGVDLRRSPTLMAPNRARKLLNWSVEEPGALITRAGYAQKSTAAIFSGPPQGGARIYLANSVFSVLAGGGALYKPDDSWASTGPVFSTRSATNPIFFPFDRDLVMAMDSANRPVFSTNGSSWMLVGIDAPSSLAVLSTGSSGAMSSGEYAIAYAYKHRGTAHVSNVSGESTASLASTGSIHATAAASTDAKVDAYVWYARHKAPDQESVLRKVSSGAASTFTFTSTTWTTNDEASTNHHAPPALSFAAVWKNRWWAKDAVVGNRLRFTELFQPQSWPTLYFIDIPFERGDSIVAIQPLGDALIVHGQSGMFLVIGQTALDFEVRPSQGGDTGAFGPRAVARVEQATIHASADGVATFDGASDRSLEPDINVAWRDVVQNSASTSLSNVAVLHDRQRHEVAIAVPRVYPTAARGEWMLNLDRTQDQQGQPAWTTTDRDVAFYIHWDGNEPTAGNRGRVFFLPSTVGHVYEASTGASANSSNMVAQYEGPTLSFGQRRARIIGTHVEFEPNDGSFSLDLVVDNVPQGSQPVMIGAAGAVIGTAVIGTSQIAGGGRLQKYITWPITAYGQTAALNATYIGQQRYRFYSYAHVILPDPSAVRVG